MGPHSSNTKTPKKGKGENKDTSHPVPASQARAGSHGGGKSQTQGPASSTPRVIFPPPAIFFRCLRDEK